MDIPPDPEKFTHDLQAYKGADPDAFKACHNLSDVKYLLSSVPV